jgi:hypothetical protein
LLESLALSLPSEECWNSALLTLNAKWMTEESQIEEETVQVNHASQPAHLEEHIQWIQERLRRDIQDGNDLWNRKTELFPLLTFCDTAAPSIRSLSPTMLRPIVRRLFELETYCQGWTEGGFDPTQLATKATPESQATLSHYGRDRTFLCPDGEMRTFSWHVRLSRHHWRIHFYPEPEIRRMIIGYVGPHLPTAKYH